MTAVVNTAPVHQAVRTAEVDVLENAVSPPRRRREGKGGHLAVRKPDHFSRMNVSEVASSDQVKGAGLRCEYKRTVHLPQTEGSHAIGITNRVQVLTGQNEQGKSTSNVSQDVQQSVIQVFLSTTGQQVQNHLGIRGRLKNGALAFQASAKQVCVYEVPVMSYSDGSSPRRCEQGLSVKGRALTMGRITDVTDCRVAD
jgi:hypothetical protein